MIAGGISNKNVTAIIEKFNPEFLDVSSSLEDSPGKKNHQKINEFFDIINDISKKQEVIRHIQKTVFLMNSAESMLQKFCAARLTNLKLRLKKQCMIKVF